MINKKVTKYLEKNGIDFEVLEHRTIYTAYDLAQTLKADLKKIAKTLLIKADKDYVLVVLPANYRLDLAKLKKALKVKKVQIPNEKMIVKVLKVKIGGLTPFGTLHKLETVVDKSLLKTKKMILNAGSFTESLHLNVKDFIELEEAKLASFVASAKYKKPKVTKAKKKTVKKVAKKAIKTKNKK